MNEAQARQVLLLRAFEDPVVAPWTEADRDAVSRAAERELGEGVAAEQLIAHRAALAMPRLLALDPTVHAALADSTVPTWLGPAMLLVAFGAGLAIDSLGGVQRINLFALPLLTMLAWNLAVYALLAVHAMRGHGAPHAPALVQALTSRLGSIPRLPSPALARFVADWTRASWTLQTTRLATWLHAAAAVLAIGALASMYARGSFFEFRAGWDSTFFDAPTLHRLVTWLLGPAARVSGVALPEQAEFATLRFSTGSGEVAARWIHLYALTVVGVVVLPRALLTAWAGLRARRIAQSFALPLQQSYFQRLLPKRRGATVAVQVLPYSYHLPPERAAELPAVLAAECAGTPQVQLAHSVPLGGEEDPQRWWCTSASEEVALRVALFPLTATPERETHGAFVRDLAEHLPAGVRLIVLVDEAGFRQHFGAASGADRLEQRRDAWRRLMRELGHEPRFADLTPTQPVH